MDVLLHILKPDGFRLHRPSFMMVSSHTLETISSAWLHINGVPSVLQADSRCLSAQCFIFPHCCPCIPTSIHTSISEFVCVRFCRLVCCMFSCIIALTVCILQRLGESWVNHVDAYWPPRDLYLVWVNGNVDFVRERESLSCAAIYTMTLGSTAHWLLSNAGITFTKAIHIHNAETRYEYRKIHKTMWITNLTTVRTAIIY